jgi:hypothetical protein
MTKQANLHTKQLDCGEQKYNNHGKKYDSKGNKGKRE